MKMSETVCTAINNMDEETGINDYPVNDIPNTQNFTEEDEIPSSSQNARPSCKFGRQCFRKNPIHRKDIAHPGDSDYIVPDMPEPKEGATSCQYGRKCYRLNPEHFKNFIHPRNINIQKNYKKYILERQSNRRNSSDDDASDDDPFGEDSGGSDYLPSEED